MKKYVLVLVTDEKETSTYLVDAVSSDYSSIIQMKMTLFVSILTKNNQPAPNMATTSPYDILSMRTDTTSIYSNENYFDIDIMDKNLRFRGYVREFESYNSWIAVEEHDGVIYLETEYGTHTKKEAREFGDVCIDLNKAGYLKVRHHN